MIKHMNEDEIYILKSKFREIIRVKKLLSTDITTPFKEGILNFNDSVKIFLTLEGNKIIDVENRVEIFLRYLKNSNLLDKNILENIETCSFDYSRDYTEEEYEEKETEFNDTSCGCEILDDIFKSICEIFSIDLAWANLEDIIFNLEFVDNEFTELSKSHSAIYEDYKDEEDPGQAFLEAYGETGTVYVFKGIKFSDAIIDIVNMNAPRNAYTYGGIRTEMFSKGNNTFLTLSDVCYWEPINREFLLTVICSLIKEGGKFRC